MTAATSYTPSPRNKRVGRPKPNPTRPEGFTPSHGADGMVTLPAWFQFAAPASAIRVATAYATLTQDTEGVPWTLFCWNSQDVVRARIPGGMARSTFAEGLAYCLNGDPDRSVPPLMMRTRERIYEGGRITNVLSIRFNLSRDGSGLRDPGDGESRPTPRRTEAVGPRPGPGTERPDRRASARPDSRAPASHDGAHPSGHDRAHPDGRPILLPCLVLEFEEGEEEKNLNLNGRVSDSGEGPKTDAARAASPASFESDLAALTAEERVELRAAATQRLDRRQREGPAAEMWIESKTMELLGQRLGKEYPQPADTPKLVPAPAAPAGKPLQTDEAKAVAELVSGDRGACVDLGGRIAGALDRRGSAGGLAVLVAAAVGPRPDRNRAVLARAVDDAILAHRKIVASGKCPDFIDGHYRSKGLLRAASWWLIDFGFNQMAGPELKRNTSRRTGSNRPGERRDDGSFRGTVSPGC